MSEHEDKVAELPPEDRAAEPEREIERTELRITALEAAHEQTHSLAAAALVGAICAVAIVMVAMWAVRHQLAALEGEE
jgi:hypothetical protein